MRGGGSRHGGGPSGYGGMPHGMFFATSMSGNPSVFGFGGNRYAACLLMRDCKHNEVVPLVAIFKLSVYNVRTMVHQSDNI